MEAQAGESFQMQIFLIMFPRMSLDCKLVPVSSTVRIRISSISIDICYFSVYSLVLFRLRGCIKHSRQCFIGYPTSPISSKIRRCASYFQLSSRCLHRYPDETLSLVLSSGLVFDILPITCYYFT